MLEAFYRAIKAVNQSLLNDPWFLTCFIGSETVVATHCTHGSALGGLPTQAPAVWTMNTICDSVIVATAPGCGLRVNHRCSGWKRRKSVQRSRSRNLQWLLWFCSCPCIPVETYLRLSGTHTNSVLQGTYRQLTCFRLETALSEAVGLD